MTITKDECHRYFFINDGWLCESYNTARGPRWRHKIEVPGHIDVEMISEELINKTILNENGNLATVLPKVREP